MQTQTIRRQFLGYFKKQGHVLVPSAPVVPHDDPTLLFNNAGMNQFKDVFLGKSTRDYSRAVSSQKCIRVGGKHNDLENVGHTSRHLTFFEMLGNFSFGDYFKKEAIAFSWELATEIFQFDPEKIWPTVYEKDDEAFELWTRYVPAEKITRFGKKHNYWAMGDTGPCGPCSELLYDRGEKYGDARNPTEDVQEERYFEFWNLVFMQDNMSADGEVTPLPKPCVDTGAGLERIVDVKMGASSVFETDVLRGLIAEVEKISGKVYDKEPAFHVIADHMRCLSFAIADGAQPSNVDRGYVLRKVLRRATRYAKQLGIEKPFLSKLLPSLIHSMGEDYPELVSAKFRIEEILTIEEEAFIRTLKRGGNLLNQIIEDAKQQISGDDAFKLKDTYGFPIEEILLLAKDSDLTVDTKRYEALEEEAKIRSRKVHKGAQQIAEKSLFVECQPSRFLGYTEHTAKGKVTALVVGEKLVNEMQAGDEGLVVLDQTPFYAEKGGQVGDTGTLTTPDLQFDVHDCQEPYTGVTAHLGKLSKGSLKVGDTVTACIDRQKRQKIANNHTATHLLHWALQVVLGEHVKQAGSVVDSDRLRFDFSHHKALSKEETRAIEDLVNAKIRDNLPVQNYEIPFEEAQEKREIKQFFGDKYGKTVRVIDIDYSKELCGGTHTSQVGNIGLFRIAKESSIAAGVRRIEAVTGEEAEALAREQDDLLHELAATLKTQPQKLETRIEKLLEENKELSQQLKRAKKQQMGSLVDALLEKVEVIDDTKLLTVEVSLSPDEMRTLADALTEKIPSGVVVLGAAFQERANLLARVSPDLISKGIKAVDIIKSIAPTIEGGGGGKADSAQAGGKAPKKISEALKNVRQCLSH